MNQPSSYSADSLITGWRRLIGSTKLQVIFHKRATKYRSLLRKMTYKDKGSYESSPPCTSSCHGHSFPCSSSVPSHNCHHFSRFWDLLYGSGTSSDWDLALGRIFGPNFTSTELENSPVFPATSIP